MRRIIMWQSYRFNFAFMFRISASILLLFSFLVQSFRGTIIMLDYYSNIAAYTKNCINKSKPALHCKGKCQMVKKIQEEEKKESSLPQRKSEIKIEVFTAFPGIFYVDPPIADITTSVIPYDISHALKDMSFDIFHPPQA